jgi:hypothetical protein
MRVERIQLSLVSETKQIARLATTRRINNATDLTKDGGGYHHHQPTHDEHEEVEGAPVPPPSGTESSTGLLNLTA